MTVTIRPVEGGGGDARAWGALRHALWPHAAAPELLAEARAFLAGEEIATLAAAFLAEDRTERRAVGFVEVSIRPFADGCQSRPIPHVEGWYVEPAARQRGVGRALMACAEEWARALGFSEMASDTEVENEAALAAHARCGYVETERLVKLRKPLNRTAS
ncbi:MAG TPA: GNAT family N-acetyltransferase [Candidatus Cybelea sp.]|jgi:aminoglycoside 6'-N-acetyltransferase I|nr:GNAT family N-acetyltransferase [Candidatus Cybelea sp.]